MSEETVDPLLELFHQELREQSEALRGALSDLQTVPGNRAPLDQACQAAHTIRGAARIVGRDAVARLAAWIENLFAGALSASQNPGPNELETCRRLCDAFAELGNADPAEPEAVSFAELEALIAPATPPTALVVPEPMRPLPAAPPPRSSAAVSPAPPPMPSTFAHIDPTMLELFREEARSHAGTLTAGLLDLERDPANPQRIEPLMRAAHSLKGAARIVGLDAAVGLAHEMEDALVAAQTGRIRISAAEIDVLLRGTDVLATLASEDLARWGALHADAVEELRGTVSAIARGEGVATVAPISATLTPTEEIPLPRTEAAPVNVPPARVEATAAQSRSGETSETVVRVTAQSLDRLMSLAGESLVQSRWLQPFAGALLQLQKRQDRLTHLLDQLGNTTSSASLFEQKLAEAKHEATQNRCEIAKRKSEFDDHAGAAEDLNSRLYREVIVSRMRPFADGAHAFPRLVRDTARRLGKQARLDIVGHATEVDRDILEKLEAPLTHLLRNAVDHGLEATEDRLAVGKPPEGVLRVEAHHRAGMLSISVSDDGAGINAEKIRRKIVERRQADPEMAARMSEAELLEFLFLPGFSTASVVSETSGRGVGLDVVQDTVRKVGGSVQISTQLGRGTAFHLSLPITLSVLRAVLVDIAGEPYAFPHNRIDRLLRVRRDDIHALEHRQFITVDGRHVGLVLASQLLDLPAEAPAGDELPIVLLSDSTGVYGLLVESIRGEQDLVVRPLDPRLGKVPNVSAAAVLDDGAPVLIADVEDMIRSMDQFIQAGTLKRCDRSTSARAARKRILVVDDSITVREVQRQILRTHGYEVEVAIDGQDGWNKVSADSFDLVISDIDMPRMTGLEFVRRIRDDLRMKELPVIIVSYKDRDEDRLQGMQVGANHYLTKSSFHDDTYLQAVADLIGR